ncbi:MAG TPA: hypothetical protein VJS12_14545 [Steroidobacteraceae bacterium]|nr:hypothetical protein [Steroidobacteraceae bacterium]
MRSSSRYTWILASTALLGGHVAQAAEEAHGHAQGEQGHTHAQATDERQSNDRAIEITAAGSNVWELKTKSRLVQMRLVERDGKPFAEFIPKTYEGAPSPFAADNTLSLELNPGTDRARRILLRKEDQGTRLVTTDPLPSTGAFDAALYMDEKDHIHRLRFRFPGAK